MWGQNGSERGAKFGPFLKGPNWPYFIGAVLGSKFWPHFWGQNGPFLFTVYVFGPTQTHFSPSAAFIKDNIRHKNNKI